MEWEILIAALIVAVGVLIMFALDRAYEKRRRGP